jgi:hypothetical protein
LIRFFAKGSSHAHGAWLARLAGLVLAGVLLVGLPQTAWATELGVRDVVLEPCPAEDVGAQPELRRPTGASCYALRGVVTNPGRKPVVDTDVFAVPAGTPAPISFRNVKARGFKAPVRMRAGADDELLPLEQALAGS